MPNIRLRNKPASGREALRWLVLISGKSQYSVCQSIDENLNPRFGITLSAYLRSQIHYLRWCFFQNLSLEG
jgi:hypothetical protein